MKSSPPSNPPLNPKSKRLIRTKWTMIRNSHYSQKTSKSWRHSWWIRPTFRNPHHTRRIHRPLWNLPPWSRLTGGLHHWKGDTLPKLVACGPSNMRSSHQNSMSSSSRHNSKETLLWISKIYLTISICLSMRWLDSEKTYFLINSSSKDTLSLKNTLSQIAITLTTPGMPIYTLLLDTHSLWQWRMKLL